MYYSILSLNIAPCLTQVIQLHLCVQPTDLMCMCNMKLAIATHSNNPMRMRNR